MVVGGAGGMASKVTSIMLNGNDLITASPLGYLLPQGNVGLLPHHTGEGDPRDRWDTRRGGGVLSRQRTEKELNHDPSAHVTKI